MVDLFQIENKKWRKQMANLYGVLKPHSEEEFLKMEWAFKQCLNSIESFLVWTEADDYMSYRIARSHLDELSKSIERVTREYKSYRKTNIKVNK